MDDEFVANLVKFTKFEEIYTSRLEAYIDDQPVINRLREEATKIAGPENTPTTWPLTWPRLE